MFVLLDPILSTRGTRCCPGSSACRGRACGARVSRARVAAAIGPPGSVTADATAIAHATSSTSAVDAGTSNATYFARFASADERPNVSTITSSSATTAA